MGVRDHLFETLAALFDFGRVTATKQSTETKTVLASIEGNGGDEPEARPYQQIWGHAAIVFRPPADTEVLFVRRGEEMLPIASRETRWQIDVEEGEVVVRNLVSDSAQQARIRLKANGECVIDSPKVYIGDGAATEKIALGTAIKNYLGDLRTHLESMRTTLNTHIHPLAISAASGAGGTGTSSATATPMSTSAPAVPDIESRHVVEN